MLKVMQNNRLDVVPVHTTVSKNHKEILYAKQYQKMAMTTDTFSVSHKQSHQSVCITVTQPTKYSTDGTTALRQHEIHV